ncbi:MAG: hypothetical protein Q9174_004121 [Haloplaca sp. 1 TL-2023]
MDTGDVYGIKVSPRKVSWLELLLDGGHIDNAVKALKSYEGHVKNYANQIDQAISLHTREAIAINKFFYWFSFDVMGHFAFSKSFGMLKDESWHHAVEMLRKGLALVGPFTPVPWLIRLEFDIPILRVVRDFQSMTAWCAKRMKERIEIGVGEGDISSKLIAQSAKHGRLISDRNTLNRDAIAMVIAGSDTVALTLPFIFYHPAQNPDMLSKLQKELDTLDPDHDMQDLQDPPYLNGIINETMRLHPAVPTGGLRETPPNGAVVAGRFVPSNTVIFASCFDHPHVFIPERWSTHPDLIKDKSAFAPFALGRYSCIGKNLAYMEMRCVVALLARKHDVAFPEGETGEDVERDMVDQFTATLGGLRVVLRGRGQEKA